MTVRDAISSAHRAFPRGLGFALVPGSMVGAGEISLAIAVVALAVVHFAMAFACGHMGARVLMPRMRSGLPALWTERARLVAALGSAATTSAVGVYFVVSSTGRAFSDPLTVLGTRTAGLAAAFGAIGGVWAAHAHLIRQFDRGRLSIGARIRGSGAAVALFGQWLLLGTVVACIGSGAADRSWVVVLGAASVLAFGLSGAGIAIARRCGFLTEAPPRLAAAMREATARTGIDARAVYVAPWRVANAFAFPPQRTVVFTEGALAALADDDIAAVCAHELGHLHEGAIVRCARVGRDLLPVLVVAVGPITGTFGTAGLAVLLGALALVRMVFRTLSRRVEEQADSVARQGSDDGTYARALERLYAANLTPAVFGRRTSSHPDLYDRMVHAGVTPDYPRPNPPAWGLAAVSAAVTITLALGGSLGLAWIARAHLLPL